jgi:hypothetical protein
VSPTKPTEKLFYCGKVDMLMRRNNRFEIHFTAMITDEPVTDRSNEFRRIITAV